MTNEPHPDWAPLIMVDSQWSFVGGQLVHDGVDKQAPLSILPPHQQGVIHRLLVKHIWAAQKNSIAVKRVLKRIVNKMQPGEWGLNLGSGETRFHDCVLNLDIYKSDNIDIVNIGTALPFRDSSLDLVISQEVLEHVDFPGRHILEVCRVLKPGGLFYCQLPFIIGYHPGPCDFWRFTKESYPKLFSEKEWEIVELDLSLGHGSGFYRILVEFLAVNASIFSEKLYVPVKGLCSILFFPLQYLDRLTKYSKQQDRIPGGYYCIARRKG